jgi:hypothetical protein
MKYVTKIFLSLSVFVVVAGDCGITKTVSAGRNDECWQITTACYRNEKVEAVA